jgi:CBS domain-containing protein
MAAQDTSVKQDTLVKDVMLTRVDHVTPESSLQDIAICMRDSDVGAVPVSQDDQLIGMITERDIVVRGLAGTMEVYSMTARDIMSPTNRYCFEDQPLDEVLHIMADQKVRRLPVVSREKRLVGVVSIRDLPKEGALQRTGESLEKMSSNDK